MAPWLPNAKKCTILCSLISTQYQCVTDRETDRHASHTYVVHRHARNVTD